MDESCMCTTSADLVSRPAGYWVNKIATSTLNTTQENPSSEEVV
jgi:hypothetical protein